MAFGFITLLTDVAIFTIGDGMEKTKTKKRNFFLGKPDKYFGTILYGEGQTYQLDTEEKMDIYMQIATKENLKQHGFEPDFTVCMCCKKQTKPKERIVIKFWNDEFENRAWYTFFCSQQCYDDFFDVDEDNPEDEIDEEIIEIKKSIVAVWK